VGILSIMLSISVLFGVGMYLQMDLKYCAIYMIAPSLIICAGVFMVISGKNENKEEGEKGESEEKAKGNPFKVTLITNKNSKKFIENINRGVSIFGSSGSGKTEGPIYSLLRHYSQHKFAGIINDYKEGEITEMAYPLFRNSGVEFCVFSINDVNRSVRINPITPENIVTESDVNGVVKTLLLNLTSGNNSDDTAKFFNDAAESLLAGVIWRLKNDYPDKCNLPFVISLLLNPNNLHTKKVPFGKLVNFLQEDNRAALLAGTFLTGTASEKQTAALFSTLANNLRTLASPEIFYLLSANEVNLDVNNNSQRKVICFVNSPGQKETIISPINAMLIEMCFNKMSVHKQDPSFVLLEEAPTIKLAGLGKRVATLRSYGISFVYCIQDKIQGTVQWSGKDYMIKEILANLSTQFFGKVNDPDTALFYEKYFEIIKTDQKSYSSKDTMLGKADKRITKTKKEEKKIKGFEFFKLQAGEFVMFSEGIDTKFRFKYYQNMARTMPAMRRVVSDYELSEIYNEILNSAANFLTNK